MLDTFDVHESRLADDRIAEHLAPFCQVNWLHCLEMPAVDLPENFGDQGLQKISGKRLSIEGWLHWLFFVFDLVFLHQVGV